MIWTVILTLYCLGWAYTGYTFWKYGVTHNNGDWLRPIAPAVVLSLLWPLILSLAMFKETE